MKKHTNKLVSLFSSGIDAPVATHLMMQRGAEIVLVHMDSRSSIDRRPVEKVRKLASILAKAAKKGLRLYLVPHGNNQQEIAEKCPQNLMCILCRRLMYRIAETIAEKEGANGIVTGENLGQVASQTLDNLAAEGCAISLPVHRPLLGFDKEEIIRVAKELGTYETSTLPGEGCIMAPKFPKTHAILKEIEEAESNLDVDEMIKRAVENARVITIHK